MEKIMIEEINSYCDESCHLQYDKQKVMVLGGIICPNDSKQEIFKQIRSIKKKHRLSTYKLNYEMKWTKISTSKIAFYYDILDYFFNNNKLRFRGLIVPNKSILEHQKYNQTHNTFYYKMYYELLNTITKPPCKYNIYLDIKDTNGANKVKELKSFLPRTVDKIQIVRSDEIELIQLADIFIGAIAYYCRDEINSISKFSIMKRLNQQAKEITGYDISETTNYFEKKFNILKIKLQGDKSCE